MGIPATLTWASVTAQIGDLLANPLVLAGVAASLAISFAPRIINALRNSVRGR